MQISNIKAKEIDQVFELYDYARAFQQTKPVVRWPQFDRAMVAQEIEVGHQWKIVIEGRIACVWATTFSDPDIWGEKNEDPAVYIHRIATHPDFRGQNFVAKIVEWCHTFAKAHQKKYIRLDTLGKNTGLIQYYEKSGFNFLGFFTIQDTSKLPEHYQREPIVCRFEIAIE